MHLNKISGEVKTRGVPDLDFLHKQLDNAMYSVKNYDNLNSNKLLIKGANSCAILSFEEIGT